MIDLDGLARRGADQLASGRVGVVVAVLAADRLAVAGAGRTAAVAGAVPDAGTVFEIGSVSKVFTALCLARMVVAGDVGLDEPLRDLLPPGTRVPSRDGTEITLRHLATHTSGLPRLPKGMLVEALLRPGKPDPYRDCTAGFLLRGLAGTRVRARPGRRFHYSNLGGGLLGLALAHRAGTDYPGLIRRWVSGPLGLADTGVTVEGARAARFAQGYTARRRPTAPWHLADLAGAGGLRSTAADLAAFLRAQVDPVDEEFAAAVRLCWEVRHPLNPFAWIHLGWLGQRLHPRQGGQLQIWHNGATGGFAAFAGFDPEARVAVAVLSNTARSVDRVAFDLLQRARA